MLPKEKRMEVLEAYDLTKSFRAAGQLTGVDHHSVARVVTARALDKSLRMHGRSNDGGRRLRRQDRRVDQELQRAHPRRCRPRQLADMGYSGSARTTRRVVAALKADHDRQHRRIYKAPDHRAGRLAAI